MQIYQDRTSASRDAADQLAAALRESVDQRGRASIAVSGGSTPLDCLQQLSKQAVPWRDVAVTLTDERQVPADHVDSNERMVSENLLVGAASDASFVRLQDVQTILPLTCCLVGMGEDGHFASIFPDSPQLAEALESAEPTIEVQTPSSPYLRISLTLDALVSSPKTILLAFGENKRALLENPIDYPVNHLLNLETVQVLWAP